MSRGLVVLAFVAALAQVQEAPKASVGTSHTGKGASDKPTDCSIVETFLGNDVLATRTYKAPPPTGAAGIWVQAPYVKAIARCGNLYIFQVASRSRDAWVIQQARVEGPNGESLQVNALRFNKDWHWATNVIVAEGPPGGAVSKLKLTLTSADGRAAQVDARDLP